MAENNMERIRLTCTIDAVNSSNKSIHVYWSLSDSISEQEFRELQTHLAEFCSSDNNIFNKSRVMHLPGTCRDEGTPVQLISNKKYQYEHADFDQLLPLLEQVEKRKKHARISRNQDY